RPFQYYAGEYPGQPWGNLFAGQGIAFNVTEIGPFAYVEITSPVFCRSVPKFMPHADFEPNLSKMNAACGPVFVWLQLRGCHTPGRGFAYNRPYFGALRCNPSYQYVCLSLTAKLSLARPSRACLRRVITGLN